MQRCLRFGFIIFLLTCLSSGILRADFIWAPAMYYGGILTWWIIILGLLAEYPFYLFAFKLGWSKSGAATLVANLISAGIGLAIWYPLAYPTNKVIGWLTMPPAPLLPFAFIAGFLLGLYINVRIESYVVSKLFHVQLTTPHTKALAFANALSMLITIGGVMCVMGYVPGKY